MENSITITVLGQPVTINDNEQDIVRYVYDRVLKNGPSVDVRGNCKYRHGKCACAAGYCIDDSLIGGEGQQIDRFLMRFTEEEQNANENLSLLRKHEGLFVILQSIHDSTAGNRGDYFKEVYSDRMIARFPYLSDKTN